MHHDPGGRSDPHSWVEYVESVILLGVEPVQRRSGSQASHHRSADHEIQRVQLSDDTRLGQGVDAMAHPNYVPKADVGPKHLARHHGLQLSSCRQPSGLGDQIVYVHPVEAAAARACATVPAVNLWMTTQLCTDQQT
jgi:hypothetical protein